MGLWDWSEEDAVKWAFVVDTNEYAGNFERELSGYICGRGDGFGDHRVALFIEQYRKDLPDDPFEDLIDYRVSDPGDDGIHRAPMDLAPTPGRTNNGFGKERDLKPGEKAKFPAYDSVAIFLTRKPTKKELKILCERARGFLPFAQTVKEKIRFSAFPGEVRGTRLVREETVLTSQSVE